MIRNTKDTEETLKNYESRLRDVSKVPAEEKEVEDHRNLLKVVPLSYLQTAPALYLAVKELLTCCMFFRSTVNAR